MNNVSSTTDNPDIIWLAAKLGRSHLCTFSKCKTPFDEKIATSVREYLKTPFGACGLTEYGESTWRERAQALSEWGDSILKIVEQRNQHLKDNNLIYHNCSINPSKITEIINN